MAIADHVVVLAEPDRATRELYQRALAPSFQVILVSDEHTLLHLLHTRHFRALVLEPMLLADYTLEQLAVISRICAEQISTLIVCTTLDQRRRAVELGVAAYLVKPILPAALLSSVRQVIAKEGAEHGGPATAGTG